MYTGLFQYNAEIVPVLLFATIEAIVVLIRLVRRFLSVCNQREGVTRGVFHIAMKKGVILSSHSMHWLAWKVEFLLLVGLLSLTLVSALRYDFRFHGNLPFSANFIWPKVTSHNVLAQRFVQIIPPTASVSAQSRLVPHVSQRRDIYLFPYASDSAEYIFLDITSDTYPYLGTEMYEHAVHAVIASGHYGILAQDDGFLLLKRGLPPPPDIALDMIFATHSPYR
jgi:hypothetical protein